MRLLLDLTLNWYPTLDLIPWLRAFDFLRHYKPAIKILPHMSIMVTNGLLDTHVGPIAQTYIQLCNLVFCKFAPRYISGSLYPGFSKKDWYKHQSTLYAL